MKILLINDASALNQFSSSITLKSIIEANNNTNFIEFSLAKPLNNNLVNLKTINIKTLTYPVRKIFSFFFKSNNKKIFGYQKTGFKFYFFKNLLLFIINISPVFLTKDLKNIIILEKPTFIYTFGTSLFSLKLSSLIASKYNIPVVIHHLDNYLISTQKNDFLSLIHHKLIYSSTIKLYKHCKICLAISDDLANQLNYLTGKSHLVLMNSIKPLSKFVKSNVSNPKILKIGYFGGLHLDRWKSLLLIQDAIRAFNYKSKIRFIMHVYSASVLTTDLYSKFDKKCIIFKEWIDNRKVSKLYKKYDVLIHFESIEQKYYEFIKFSISTKLTEYIASGKPVLFFGPKNISMARFIEKFNLGSASSDYTEFKDSLHLISNINNRILFSKNAILASKNFSFKSTRDTFQKIISEII